MTEAYSVDFEEAAGGIEIETLQGEPIPFAGPELMLKLKRGCAVSTILPTMSSCPIGDRRTGGTG